MTEEVGQLVQDVQPILPSVPLAAQDPEASQPPATQDPQPVRFLSPTKMMSLEPITEPVLSKKSLGGTFSSIQASEPYSPLINMLNLISCIFSF